MLSYQKNLWFIFKKEVEISINWTPNPIRKFAISNIKIRKHTYIFSCSIEDLFGYWQSIKAEFIWFFEGHKRCFWWYKMKIVIHFLVVLFSGHKAQMNLDWPRFKYSQIYFAFWTVFTHFELQKSMFQFTFFNIYSINKNKVQRERLKSNIFKSCSTRIWFENYSIS